MRRFLLALLILVFLVSGALFLQSRVNASAEALLSVTERLETALLSENAPLAQEGVDEFQTKWRTKKGWMYLLLPHEAMDDLESSAEYLSHSLTLRDFSGALYALSHIRADLNSIQSRDRLTWDNIL